MEEETYVPFLNCGWKSADDGCCSHPGNATPECHQFICPIKAAQPSEQADVESDPKKDKEFQAALAKLFRE